MPDPEDFDEIVAETALMFVCFVLVAWALSFSITMPLVMTINP